MFKYIVTFMINKRSRKNELSVLKNVILITKKINKYSVSDVNRIFGDDKIQINSLEQYSYAYLNIYLCRIRRYKFTSFVFYLFSRITEKKLSFHGTLQLS